MSENFQTSVVGDVPEITAPVRLEGQSNSEVLFNWLTVNRYLWLLEAPYDEELEMIVGNRARFHLGFRLIQWKRDPRHHRGHPALAAPESDDTRRVAFERLERLIRIHLLDGCDSSGRSTEDVHCDQ